MSAVDAFSPEKAAEFAQGTYRLWYGGWGDEGRVLEKMSRETGMSARSLKRLMKGETKDVKSRIFGKIYSMYLRAVERQIGHLQHEIENQRARYGDAHVESVETKAAALDQELAARKERARA